MTYSHRELRNASLKLRKPWIRKIRPIQNVPLTCTVSTKLIIKFSKPVIFSSALNRIPWVVLQSIEMISYAKPAEIPLNLHVFGKKCDSVGVVFELSHWAVCIFGAKTYEQQLARGALNL